MYVMTRVRRRQPAGEDRHARLRRLRRHQQVRPQGRAGRAARRAKQVQRNREAVRAAGRRDAGVRHHGRALQRRRRHRALPGAEGRLAAWACRSKEGGSCRWSTSAPQHEPDAHRADRGSRYLAEIAETVRGYHSTRPAGAARARRSSCANRAHAGRGRQKAGGMATRLRCWRWPTSGGDRDAAKLIEQWPDPRGLRRRRKSW